MKRTQIYLTEEEQEKLDPLSDEKGVSRSALIREAVDEYIDNHSPEHRKKYSKEWLVSGKTAMIYLILKN